METTLHRQLKERYAGKTGKVEVRHGRYRIDVVRGKRLIEIQQSSLSAIRDKIQKLCHEAESSGHQIEVVKPLIIRKQLIKLDAKSGNIVDRRKSPKRGKLTDLFAELVYFTRAFPHPQLTLVVPEIEVEETRYPGHGKRRRRRQNDFQVEEIRIVEFGRSNYFRKPHDWLKLIRGRLPVPFDTADLATRLDLPRWEAQRAAYALRNIGAIKAVGKRGNAVIYEKTPRKRIQAA